MIMTNLNYVYVVAVKWYRLAVEQGLASAQADLGSMYATGEGVPQDDGEAVKWYRLATEQGNASASAASQGEGS